MKNTSLLVVSKETDIEVNADKINYMSMAQDQNAGQSDVIKIDSKFFERKKLEQIEVRECLLSFGAESCLPVCYPKI